MGQQRSLDWSLPVKWERWVCLLGIWEYLMMWNNIAATPMIELKHRKIILQVRPGTSRDRKRILLEEWYRDRLRDTTLPLIAKWEKLAGVQVKKFYVRRMKTKWGSCNPSPKSIRLNTELAKKPSECLEYIVVHELVHLIEPTQNSRFLALMDRLMPKWSFYRDMLNAPP